MTLKQMKSVLSALPSQGDHDSIPVNLRSMDTESGEDKYHSIDTVEAHFSADGLQEIVIVEGPFLEK